MPVAEGHRCGHSEPSLKVTVELACLIFRLGTDKNAKALLALTSGAHRADIATLAELAGEDLSLARLGEGHVDALAILAERPPDLLHAQNHDRTVAARGVLDAVVRFFLAGAAARLRRTPRRAT